MSDWSNPCGGHRWRTLSNGLVEVEGAGTPIFEPASPQFQHLARTWSSWGGLMRASARRYSVPISWMPAIATTETGAWANDPQQQATIISAAGAVGVMQVIPSYQKMTTAQLQNPATNIDTSAKILSRLIARYGYDLPAVAAAYNAGGVYCSPGLNEWNLRAEGNYPRQALTFNNSALTFLDLGEPVLAWMITGGVISGALAVGYFWLRSR